MADHRYIKTVLPYFEFLKGFTTKIPKSKPIVINDGIAN